ncbi:MAG: hypothetical protein E6J88_06460 [Deltaproteobacteria bacterium]|nr:MAG: hypothetical protein E6J88_06460 [Deltaproteobacteria bacterium]
MAGIHVVEQAVVAGMHATVLRADDPAALQARISSCSLLANDAGLFAPDAVGFGARTTTVSVAEAVPDRAVSLAVPGVYPA